MLSYASTDIEARINGHRSKDKWPQKLASMLSSTILGKLRTFIKYNESIDYSERGVQRNSSEVRSLSLLCFLIC